MRSTLSDIKERQRRAVLGRIADALANNARSHTSDEQRAAALAIGRPEYVPEPQDELPLENVA